MSNMTVIVADAGNSARVRKFVRMYGDEDEQVFAPFGEGSTCWVISKGVRDLWDGRQFFKGCAYSSSEAIFSLVGLKDFDSASKGSLGQFWGSFYHIRKIDSAEARLEIVRDAFGLSPVFYTSGNGFSAASDSFGVLVKLRRDLKESLSLNEEVLLSRSLLNLLSAQQGSRETYFNEISFLPPGKTLSLNTSAAVEGDAYERLGWSSSSYEELIVETAAAMQAQQAALDTQKGWRKNLHLSGGYDSRTVLASLIASHTSFSASTGKVAGSDNEDYRIAASICNDYSIPFGDKREFAPDGALYDSFSVWASVSGGLYDNLGPARTRSMHRKEIGINGIGGEIARQSWGTQTSEELVLSRVNLDDKHTSGAQVDALVSQISKGVAELNFEPLNSDSQRFLLGYRTSAHALGNTRSQEMYSVSPLVNVPWLQVAAKDDDRNGSLYLMAYLAPNLIARPFEGGREFSGKEILEALKSSASLPRGGRDVQVYGQIPEHVWGSSRLAINAMGELGFGGVRNFQDIVDRIGDDFSWLPGERVQRIYRKVCANASWMISRSDGHASAAGPAPAKIATLLLLRP